MYQHLSRRRFWLRIVCGAVTASQTSFAGDDQNHKDRKQESKENSGDKVYEPGGEVRPPKLIHYVEPEFSPFANEAFVEGTVKISTVVTVEGLPTELHVIRGLNAEEDRTAIEALKQWRFQPGTKSGQPVKVKITVEVDFHLL